MLQIHLPFLIDTTLPASRPSSTSVCVCVCVNVRSSDHPSSPSLSPPSPPSFALFAWSWLAQDSKPISELDLDPETSYMQITSVDPHFDEDELATVRTNDWKLKTNLARFVFETPFTLSGKVSPFYPFRFFHVGGETADGCRERLPPMPQ